MVVIKCLTRDTLEKGENARNLNKVDFQKLNKSLMLKLKLITNYDGLFLLKHKQFLPEINRF